MWWSAARRGVLRPRSGDLLGTGPQDDGRDGYLLSPVVLQPQSRGTVRLVSADPDDPPLVDPAHLTEPEDLAVLVHGLRAALWISEQDALRSRTADRSPAPDSTDAELARHVRATAETLAHPAGTARSGAPDDPDAVLDERLRVRGVTGLRVADPSAAPVVTRGHPAPPAVVIAERAADLILADLYWPPD
ncbi:GMC family oxidoreductase [Actinocorallia longicatena]|uniref:Glucose-methanol-choline oxidoreductase C-terminal domain-containing protein n=1 Tax=Actinocorallia longicatena TaxID=111803 RepID=A0ABP6Q776_9ACTN